MNAPDASPAARTRAFLDKLPLAREGGRRLRREADGSVVGDWFGCELSSVFQPVVEPASGRRPGFEAFLRILGRGERALSPWLLFSANADDDCLVALDRLARTVHALNFLAAGEDGLLFLNVHGRLLAAVSADHGAAFRKVGDALGLDAERIVIETPLAASRQPDLLAFVLRNYRSNGFRVAVNVASAAQWRQLAGLVPAHYVKIDGEALLGAGDAGVELERLAAQREGTTVVVKRLDDRFPAALPAGVLVQGFAYGRPAPRAAIVRPERLTLSGLAG